MPHHSFGSVRLSVASVVCLLLCYLAATAGCVQKPPGMPKIAPTTGVVTMDGQPLANASVVFMTETGGKATFGRTDATGRYEIRYIGTHMGAAVGPNVVKITTMRDGSSPSQWKDPIPAKYNVDSELRVDVQAVRNTFNFDLTTR